MCAFWPLSRVANLDATPETRLNKGLQLCNQDNTLNMGWAVRIDVLDWSIEPYVYGNISMGFQLFLVKYLFMETCQLQLFGIPPYFKVG